MLKPADIILVRGTGFIASAIEHITHSPYSHLAIYVKTNELIEAQGFRDTGYQALDYYQGHADVFTCDHLTDEQRQIIVDYVTSCIGEHYDYELIGWELGHAILHFPIPYTEDGTHICSTLAVDAYRRAGEEPTPGKPEPTPGDWGHSPIMHKTNSL